VITGGGSATLPDLTAYGVALPASATYQWQVFGFPTFADVDEAASQADGFLSSWRLYTSWLPWGDGAVTQSAIATFTTAP
jgi:hypothetical protein